MDINGLHSYYKKDGTKKLIAIINATGSFSTMEYWESSTDTWTVIVSATELLADGRFEFENFLDCAFIVGATEARTPVWANSAKLNDTTYTTTGTDLTGMPKARYIKKWRDLLWLGNIQASSVNYPNRIFYSDPVTAGTIAWSATNYIDIDVDDGDVIMGLGVNTDRLLIFKEFAFYRYDENSMKKTAEIGTTAHRSIKNLRNLTFWFNRQGIWRFDGGFPQLISGPVKPFIDGMTSDVYDVCAETDDDYYSLFIGNTVVDGVTHNNVWLNYSVSLDGFTIDKTADKAVVMTTYVGP